MRKCNYLFIPVFTIILLSSETKADRFNIGSLQGRLDRMGAGAAELGAGNTGTSNTNAGPQSYWNPALLPFKKQPQLGATADIRALNRNGGVIFGQNLVAPNMGVGLSIVNRGDFDVKAYDGDENFIGTARPQELGTYLGVGVKTSRRNAFGITMLWFTSNMDISGGPGDANVIGIFNFGWMRVWKNKLHTAVVIRNLGLNNRLSAEYDIIASQSETAMGLDRSESDFFPKTLVLAANYTFIIHNRPLTVLGELLDFQLVNEIIDIDRTRHSIDGRMGVEWGWFPNLTVRGGYDRGNICYGLSYRWKFNKKRTLYFDYAQTGEQYFVTFNPYTVGLRMVF